MNKGIIIYLRCLTFVILMCIIPNVSFSQNRILTDKKTTDSSISLEILESSPTAYRIKVNIHYINDKVFCHNGETFHQLYFDDETNTIQNEGEPALPVILQCIGLPNGKEYTAEITDKSWVDTTVGKIAPAQKPATNTGENEHFTISSEAYNCRIYNHELLMESNIMRWRGIDNVFLTICPFTYYPSENRLSVIREFVLTVRFSDVDGRVSADNAFLGEEGLSLFDNKGFYIGNCPKRQASSNNGYDYLIIVGNTPEIENSQAMATFRWWKAIKGYKTELVSTTTIGTDSTSIKNYIRQKYISGIRRVLFVGDHTKIPLPVLQPRQYQNDHQIVRSDYWYGCTDGDDDIQAELPIARFLTNTLTDFEHLVNKTIMYESLYHFWADRILLIANMQLAPGFYQGCLEQIRSQTYSTPMTMLTAYAAPNSLGGDSATRDTVFSRINNGINMAVYNGHGNHRDFWMDYGLEGEHPEYCIHQSDTNRINNDAYPVFISMACLNGNFTGSKSIIWQWTRSDHCATAYCGGTVPVFSYAGNYFLKQLFDEMLNCEKYNLGDLLLAANLRSLSYGNTAIDNAFCYICGGDPTLELWTGVQNSFEGIDVSSSNGTVTISVDNTCNFDVNVVSSEGVLISKYHSNASNECTIPIPAAECDISIVKHNYIPYIVHYNNGNFIQNKTFTGNHIYANTPLVIGSNVTTFIPFGDVIVSPNSNVKILNDNGVTIQEGFECQPGGEFEIKTQQ